MNKSFFGTLKITCALVLVLNSYTYTYAKNSDSESESYDPVLLENYKWETKGERISLAKDSNVKNISKERGSSYKYVKDDTELLEELRRRKQEQEQEQNEKDKKSKKYHFGKVEVEVIRNKRKIKVEDGEENDFSSNMSNDDYEVKITSEKMNSSNSDWINEVKSEMKNTFGKGFSENKGKEEDDEEKEGNDNDVTDTEVFDHEFGEDDVDTNDLDEGEEEDETERLMKKIDFQIIEEIALEDWEREADRNDRLVTGDKDPYDLEYEKYDDEYFENYKENRDLQEEEQEYYSEDNDSEVNPRISELEVNENDSDKLKNLGIKLFAFNTDHTSLKSTDEELITDEDSFNEIDYKTQEGGESEDLFGHDTDGEHTDYYSDDILYNTKTITMIL